MRIAIPTADGKLCLHFGHCQQFTVVDADPDTKGVVRTEQLTPPPHEPGVLPAWLKELGVSVVIAGGMGARAQQLFAASGIRVVTGASSAPPADIVAEFLNATLASGSNPCDH